MIRIIISLLLAFCMLPVSAGAAEPAVVYSSDFSSGADGWYGRGASSLATAEGTLRTFGRQSDWNSPGRDFELTDGWRYELSVEVRQNQADSAAFMISIAHSTGGVESYENLAHGTAKKGEWTTLTGTYTAGAFERNVLYVETTGAPTLEYEIRSFTVIAPDGLPEAAAEAEPLPSLKDIYADRFDFGAAVPRSVFSNPKLRDLALSQFSILTAENEMKPDAVLDVSASRKLVQETGDETQAAVSLKSAESLLRFAEQTGIKVHGHVLVWHSQTPEAFFHVGYDSKNEYVSREVMLGRLENYIRGIMEFLEENYPGVVVSWDVLNEAIDDGTNKLRSSNWLKVVGEDYPNRAFELARKYAPEGTLLYYNDYNTAMSGKLKGIVSLLNSLIPEGNIDGYGFQMHHKVTFPSVQQIRTAVETVAKLGLKLRVSELDVGIGSNSDLSLHSQAQLYAEVMKIMTEYSDQTEAVQVWGLTDAMSWRSREYPLLFDAAGQPKPAFWAVADPDGEW